MPKLDTKLLKQLAFFDESGNELALPARKTRALLAFLLVESDRWHERDRLAHLLWGDRGQAQARNSLNQALYEIRNLERNLGVVLTERDGTRVRVVRGALNADLFDLQDRLSVDPVAAANLYDGELLDGFELSEPAFADWLRDRRAQLNNTVVTALSCHVLSSEPALNATDCMTICRRILAIDPLHEPARRALIKLCASTGDRAEAIRQYQICEELLKSELGVAPEQETIDLLASIKRQAQPALTPGAATERDIRQAFIDTPAGEDRPVIAVLPLQNLSDDNDLEFLADGIADDLTFSLSGFKWFRVLARPAMFRLKGVPVELDILNASYGATHAVTGHVRRHGARIRVGFSLADCVSGLQIWAGRYDRPLDDLFDLEDEIVREVIAAVEPMLADAEMRRVARRAPETLSAYEFVQRGYWHIYATGDDSGAKRCFQAALDADPNYAAALSGMAYVQYRTAHTEPLGDFRQRMRECRATAEQALALDPWDPRALRQIGGANSFLGECDAAYAAISKAIEICPSYANAYSGLAFIHDWRGEFAAARPACDETIRLRPHDPVLHKCILSKSIADYATGNVESAERIARDSLRTNDTWWYSHVLLAAALGQQAQRAEAQERIATIKELYPGLTLERMMEKFPFDNAGHAERLADGLMRAGWSDQ